MALFSSSAHHDTPCPAACLQPKLPTPPIVSLWGVRPIAARRNRPPEGRGGGCIGAGVQAPVVPYGEGGYEQMRPFRFERGQPVRLITNPAKPLGTIVARWTGDALRDVSGAKIYAVRSVVTKQREPSLEACREGDGTSRTRLSPE